jgi:O-antigen ligase
MCKVKIIILLLILLPNFGFCFYFLEPSSGAKTLIFCFACLSIYLFFFLPNAKYSLLDISVYAFILIVLFLTKTLFLAKCSMLVYVVLISILLYWMLIRGIVSKLNKDFFFVFLIRIIVIMCVFVALLGIYEFYSFALLGRSDGMLIPYLVPVDNSPRVAGIYGQPNLFALLLLCGLMANFFSYLHDPVFSQARCRISYVYYLPLFVVALSFFLTGSRSGLLAMLFTVLFMCLMVARKRYLANSTIQQNKLFIIVGIICLAWLGSYLLSSFFIGAGTRALVSSGVPIEARFVFWAAAWLIFLDHPWFGIGLDNYKFYLPEYLPKAHEWLGFVQHEAMGYTNWAHNEILQLACEGGIFVLLLLLFLLGVFACQLLRFARGNSDWTPLKFYSHLFIIPFIIQSMFSWPLRHPGLLVLFFTFLAMLAAQYPCKVIFIPKWGQFSLKGVALIGLMAVVFIAVQETKMGLFAHSMTPANARNGFGRFEELVAEPCTEYPMLLNITPRYVQVALKNKDAEFGAKILPYVEKLTEIQGAHWQLYNLAAIYNLLDQRHEAYKAINEAIEVRPSEGRYWAFQHYLNMLNAAEKTGRPLEDFLPIPPGGEKKDLNDFFNFEGRDVIKM